MAGVIYCTDSLLSPSPLTPYPSSSLPLSSPSPSPRSPFTTLLLSPSLSLQVQRGGLPSSMVGATNTMMSQHMTQAAGGSGLPASSQGPQTSTQLLTGGPMEGQNTFAAGQTPGNTSVFMSGQQQQQGMASQGQQQQQVQWLAVLLLGCCEEQSWETLFRKLAATGMYAVPI